MYSVGMICDDLNENNNKQANQYQNNNNMNLTLLNNQKNIRIKRNYQMMNGNDIQSNNLNSFPEFLSKKMKLTGIDSDKKVQINNNIVRIKKTVPEKIKREMEKYQNQKNYYSSKLNVSPCNCNDEYNCGN